LEKNEKRKTKKRKTYFCTVKKTLLTFKSMTLLKLASVWSSKGAPHVAPALANRISTWSVVLPTSATSRSISLVLLASAGMEIAFAPGRRLGSALRAATASSQAEALREVM